ncbi:MAG: DUF1624 domain-containing protein [Clostridia bacterium]|nr:DUF1624 domain-containing protein [Clostridia bacterium]
MEAIQEMNLPVIINDTRTKMSRKRIWELDFLRGICIILMCLDHMVFNFAATFAKAWKATGNANLINLVDTAIKYWTHPARLAAQETVLWIFFSLCGMSIIFSRNNFFHSIKILFVAALITLVTTSLVKFGMDEGNIIRFGVLHMLGVSSFIVAIIYTFTRKNRWVTSAVFLSLALALFLFDELYLSKGAWHKDIAWLSVFSESLGDIGKFSPGDCFPMMPYIIRVFVGAGLAPLIYYKKKSLLPRLEGNWYRPINFLGRKTLWVVLLHQPVIIGALALISYFFLTPGNFGLL